jgi:hypothetical protein
MINLFRSICTVSKNSYYLRHFRPSVRMYQRGSHLDTFAWNLISETFMKLSQNANLFKIGQKYQALLHK